MFDGEMFVPESFCGVDQSERHGSCRRGDSPTPTPTKDELANGFSLE